MFLKFIANARDNIRDICEDISFSFRSKMFVLDLDIRNGYHTFGKYTGKKLHKLKKNINQNELNQSVHYIDGDLYHYGHRVVKIYDGNSNCRALLCNNEYYRPDFRFLRDIDQERIKAAVNDPIAHNIRLQLKRAKLMARLEKTIAERRLIRKNLSEGQYRAFDDSIVTTKSQRQTSQPIKRDLCPSDQQLSRSNTMQNFYEELLTRFYDYWDKSEDNHRVS